MCYHASVASKVKFEIELPQYQLVYDFEDPIYHVSSFTRPFMPVTTNDKPDVIDSAQWKLLPFWVKTEEEAKKYANTCNAESESIFEKASYKNYIGKSRGLLWVDGFFEPHKNRISGKGENYYIHFPEKRIFSIGIVVAPWVNKETGELIKTFSVLTTKANPLLEEIHNEKKRMPLIIPEGSREGWLSAQGKDQINEYLQPYDGDLLAHKVYRVTADRTGTTNRPDIQDPIS